MAVTKAALIKDWIQYLKNNQIVKLQSDPSTGKLGYNRKITSDDVTKFLEIKTDFDSEAIGKAIHSALAGKAIGKPALQNNPSSKAQEIPHDPNSISDVDYRETPRGQSQGQRQIPHDPNSISDVDYRETPRQPKPDAPRGLPAPQARAQQQPDDEESGRKPRYNKYRNRDGLNEDLEDAPGYTLDESDIEKIFSVLTTAAPEARNAKPEVPAADPAKKIEDLKAIKRMIRDTMTDSQRKSLWRVLTDA